MGIERGLGDQRFNIEFSRILASPNNTSRVVSSGLPINLRTKTWYTNIPKRKPTPTLTIIPGIALYGQ
jgi:hypothetical protein